MMIHLLKHGYFQFRTSNYRMIRFTALPPWTLIPLPHSGTRCTRCSADSRTGGHGHQGRNVGTNWAMNTRSMGWFISCRFSLKPIQWKYRSMGDHVSRRMTWQRWRRRSGTGSWCWRIPGSHGFWRARKPWRSVAGLVWLGQGGHIYGRVHIANVALMTEAEFRSCANAYLWLEYRSPPYCKLWIGYRGFCYLIYWGLIINL